MEGMEEAKILPAGFMPSCLWRWFSQEWCYMLQIPPPPPPLSPPPPPPPPPPLASASCSRYFIPFLARPPSGLAEQSVGRLWPPSIHWIKTLGVGGERGGAVCVCVGGGGGRGREGQNRGGVGGGRGRTISWVIMATQYSLDEDSWGGGGGMHAWGGRGGGWVAEESVGRLWPPSIHWMKTVGRGWGGGVHPSASTTLPHSCLNNPPPPSLSDNTPSPPVKKNPPLPPICFIVYTLCWNTNVATCSY